ncbi:MAG TPA: hypothetical protein VGY57_04545 [Vicinamibacterales bacterium]|nr:hypothetical protein [Vicinamibacterales bacterium]
MTGIGCRIVGFVVVTAICATAADAAAADWQIRPFVGFTFAGDTTFAPNLAEAAGKVHGTIGVNATVLGEIVGVDVEVAHTPGFFQTGDTNLIIGSSVTTVMGDVVIAVPGRLAEYTLRPYVVAGGGVMRARSQDNLGLFDIAEVLPAVDFGAGVVGFVSKRVGLAWDIKRFQTIGNRDKLTGISFGPEKVSFWRATMAVAIRY